MFASWSILEMIISEPSAKSSPEERLRNSWVVDDPRTRLVLLCLFGGMKSQNRINIRIVQNV
jgi:hypothetical protein